MKFSQKSSGILAAGVADETGRLDARAYQAPASAIPRNPPPDRESFGRLTEYRGQGYMRKIFPTAKICRGPAWDLPGICLEYAQGMPGARWNAGGKPGKTRVSELDTENHGGRIARPLTAGNPLFF